MGYPCLANNRECSGCQACVDSCKHDALSSYIGKDGHFYVKIDKKNCIGCLLCEKTCPVVNKTDYNNSEFAHFYAAWNRNSEERAKSASGGAFSAMAHFVLGHGGIVIGATTENVCDVKHVVISEVNEICKLQGSKYTQSDTSGIYQETFQYLKDGRTVLFSGTGCQVAGLLMFLGNKRYDGNLVTIDLICGGVPSKLLIQQFVANEPYIIKRILSFRTKEHGWKSKGFVYNMKVEDNKGEILDYTGKKNLITTCFSTEMTERYSCYDCKFVGSHRLSDFTIGDLWGDTEFPKEHHEGLSLLIAHNEKAELLLKEMEDYIHIAPCDEESAKRSNKRLENGHNPRKNLLERRFLSVFFSYFSYNTLRKLYANNYSIYSPWMLWKIIRHIYIKILLLFF